MHISFYFTILNETYMKVSEQKWVKSNVVISRKSLMKFGVEYCIIIDENQF